jgi:hypothetical protein
MRERRAYATALACLSVVALAAGCSAPHPPTRETTALPDGIRFEVMQGRTDYTSGTLVLRAINEGTADVTLSGATVSWPGFAEPAEWRKTTTLPAGRTVDLRTPLPGMNCGTGVDDSSAPTLTVDLGNHSPVVLAVDDPLGTLTRVHGIECVGARVNRVATIDLAAPLRVEGAGADAVAVLTLRFTPTGEDGSVRVSSVASTPLLAPQDGSDSWPLSISVDAATTVSTVELRVRPARCDPHAIAEDKIGTVLVLSVHVDGSDGAYRYPVDDATRNGLYEFVKSVCGTS